MKIRSRISVGIVLFCCGAAAAVGQTVPQVENPPMRQAPPIDDPGRPAPQPQDVPVRKGDDIPPGAPAMVPATPGIPNQVPPNRPDHPPDLQ